MPGSLVRRLLPRPRSFALLTAVLLVALAGGAFVAARPPAKAAGMHLHVLWEGVSPREMDRQLDRAAGANATIIRVDVGWAPLEPETKGRYNRDYLRRVDRLVAGAERRGLRLLLSFSDTPCWASSAPRARKARCRGRWWERDVQRYLPVRAADYADALAFVARRYGNRVDAWEMWNEPNLTYFLRGPDKAARYAALVRAAYKRAKPVARNVTFLAGALSEADTAFAEALYRSGIAGSFDAFSIHPYSHDASPLDPRDDEFRDVSFARGVPAIRDVMVRNGDDKPLWLTEFGWTTIRERGSRPWRNGVDPARQAAYVRQALAHTERWPYVPVIVYYNLVDRSTDPTDLVGNYGLVRADGSDKPALRAFREAAGALRRRWPLGG